MGRISNAENMRRRRAHGLPRQGHPQRGLFPPGTGTESIAPTAISRSLRSSALASPPLVRTSRGTAPVFIPVLDRFFLHVACLLAADSPFATHLSCPPFRLGDQLSPINSPIDWWPLSRYQPSTISYQLPRPVFPPPFAPCVPFCGWFTIHNSRLLPRVECQVSPGPPPQAFLLMVPSFLCRFVVSPVRVFPVLRDKSPPSHWAAELRLHVGRSKLGFASRPRADSLAFGNDVAS